MKFGEQIEMQRTYDRGAGLVEGETITVGTGDGQVTPAVARSLCRPANDGDGAYAKRVSDLKDEE